jgi:hypothetical protein
VIIFSSTDIKQKWGKFGKALALEYGTKKIEDLCHIKKSKKLIMGY